MCAARREAYSFVQQGDASPAGEAVAVVPRVALARHGVGLGPARAADGAGHLEGVDVALAAHRAVALACRKRERGGQREGGRKG